MYHMPPPPPKKMLGPAKPYCKTCGNRSWHWPGCTSKQPPHMTTGYIVYGEQTGISQETIEAIKNVIKNSNLTIPAGLLASERNHFADKPVGEAFIEVTNNLDER